MSTLTQFLPQGDSFPGEVIAGPASIWGGNPTFSGKEYLRTGLLKTYNSSYSGLFSALPTACVANESASLVADSGWYGVYYARDYGFGIWNYDPPSVFYLGGNYHFWYPTYAYVTYSGTTYSVKYGSSFASAPTQDIAIVSAQTYTGDAILFNNRILGVFVDTAGGSGKIYSSTGAGYSAVYTGSAYPRTFAASPSLVISAADINTTGSPRIVTSTNGATWTDRTSNLNMGTQARLFYSTAAAAFFYIRDNGSIYTSTDGYTWTARTAPTGMPTTVYGTTSTATVVDTATATYVMLGAPDTSSTYMLKITGLTTYSLIDLATTGSGNLVGLFSGSAGLLPWISSNGTYIYITNGKVRAYSTNGVDWTLDTQINQTLVPSYNLVYPARNFYNSSVYYMWALYSGTNYGNVIPFNFTSKSFGQAPDFVGSSAVQAFASGSSLSTYFRIK